MAAGGGFAFGPFQLDMRAKRLLRAGQPVDLSPRQFDILHALVSRAPDVVSKDHLIAAGWRDVIVGDSSLEKMIFQVRQRLDVPDPHRYIQTVARRGYRFVEAVTRLDAREAAEDLDALVVPYRAWMEGRGALETLRRDQIAQARATFERLTRLHPAEATFHIGLANACAMQYEATRIDHPPDLDALRLAEAHAQQAFRLRPDLAEASATLGFVLERTVGREVALAALGRAVRLEPENWLHLFRLAAAAWGGERLRAAGQALAYCPHLPIAHWLAASVYVARDALDLAARELAGGLATVEAEAAGLARFAAVAFHWLYGLLHLVRGAEDEAMAAFERELALESRGHVYARECAANTWYAKGAVYLRHGNHDAARAAFGETLARVGRHPMAHAGLAILHGADGRAAAARVVGPDDVAVSEAGGARPVEAAFARAALLRWAGDVPGAVGLVAAALRAAPSGNAGWLLPIEPLLGVASARDVWAPALAVLHLRAR